MHHKDANTMKVQCPYKDVNKFIPYHSSMSMHKLHYMSAIEYSSITNFFKSKEMTNGIVKETTTKAVMTSATTTTTTTTTIIITW